MNTYRQRKVVHGGSVSNEGESIDSCLVLKGSAPLKCYVRRLTKSPWKRVESSSGGEGAKEQLSSRDCFLRGYRKTIVVERKTAVTNQSPSFSMVSCRHRWLYIQNLKGMLIATYKCFWQVRHSCQISATYESCRVRSKVNNGASSTTQE